MFITADIFLKVGGHNWDFNNPTDISTSDITGNKACTTLNREQTCSYCPLVIYRTDNAYFCATSFDENPDLQASIDAFKLSHPEYFL